MRMLSTLKENPLSLAMIFSLALHGGLGYVFISPFLKLPERTGNSIEVVWITKESRPPSPQPKMTSKQKEKKIILSKTSLPLVKKTMVRPPLSSSYKKEREIGESKNLPQAFPVPLPKRRSHHPLPPYPWICRKRGQEGVVALKVKINEKGQVTEALLQKSSGHTRLDEVALEALKTWIFVEDSCTKILSIAFRLS